MEVAVRALKGGFNFPEAERDEENNVLGNVKDTKWVICEKTKLLKRLKFAKDMKKDQLEDLKAEELQDRRRSADLEKTEAELVERKKELEKRKTELELMSKGIEKEKTEIQERLKERDATATKLRIKIAADELMEVKEETDLKKVQAEVEAVLSLLRETMSE